MKKQNLALTICELAICVLCLVGCAFSLIKLENVMMKICIISSILGVFAAALYIIKGHSKNAAMFFKIFLILITVSELLRLITTPSFMYNTVVEECIGLAVVALTFGAFMLLCFVKDLGKDLSLGLCGFIILSKLFVIIALIAKDNLIEVLLLPIIQALLTVLLGLLMNEKYVDKEARGTE